MTLSSDKLNGFPSESDPNPAKRTGHIRAVNGWPEQRQRLAQKEADGTPSEQKRRVELASRNRTRAIDKVRNQQLLRIYDIPEPVKVPGQSGLFSRWLKEKGSKRVKFQTLQEFCTHILQNYGDEEKDAQWRDYLAESEPAVEEEERKAAETLAAIERAESRGAANALPTSELPASFTSSPDIAEAQIGSMPSG
ncbi:MAG: hypothetical protein GY906_30100 [bacterium]|nr:hypothetical protein [bacterium]